MQREVIFLSRLVSIPSRGFWFFEATSGVRRSVLLRVCQFQSPRGDFGFLKPPIPLMRHANTLIFGFQSPRGDFGFLKAQRVAQQRHGYQDMFQSPRGDFGFLKRHRRAVADRFSRRVSIPSRGFWFFEDIGVKAAL